MPVRVLRLDFYRLPAHRDCLGMPLLRRHHVAEAACKAVGRALREAVRRDGAEVPSTKGLL